MILLHTDLPVFLVHFPNIHCFSKELFCNLPIHFNFYVCDENFVFRHFYITAKNTLCAAIIKMSKNEISFIDPETFVERKILELFFIESDYYLKCNRKAVTLLFMIFLAIFTASLKYFASQRFTGSPEALSLMKIVSRKQQL